MTLLENRHRWRATVLGEPQLGPRGLYTAPDETGNEPELSALMNVLAYSDGEHDLLQMAERLGLTSAECLRQIRRLEAEGLVERVE